MPAIVFQRRRTSANPIGLVAALIYERRRGMNVELKYCSM
jgi:hypothetical protein